MTDRDFVLAELADHILSIECDHPVRIGIDGVDCAGKTTLADELASLVEGRPRKVIRISIDGFHNPRSIRYRQGSLSPQGFYQDTFDLPSIITSVLTPLGPEGNLRYVHRCFDFKSDKVIHEPVREAPPDAVVLFDGIFLHRPELLPNWDFTVFVDVGFDETVRRAKKRDQYLFGNAEEVEARYLGRYVPGQEIYLRSVKPRSKANVVLENTDARRPRLIWNQL